MSLNSDIAFEIGKGMELQNGDTVVIDSFACLIQEIKIESITAQYDVWYDPDFGWGLQDFIHRNIDEMLRLEIHHRVRTKLARRDVVVQESLKIKLEEKDDGICIHLQFTAYGEDVTLDLILDRIKVEVRVTNG